ncbi:hypothetical protein FNZ56_09220 [Pseudoluteimonas lycopersici]|uniref:CUB domain-containing protein n=1 Tax=Pseudoluteimonas lycopersici TaxID=1324796 RepID=A0A516V689_9GAMM|nr:hypothetical protein [Lysobacter lycopersici]QDQ74046.1 hypothetical protein FNZ56_09220 [Lysobacter lycopersici]
MRTLLLAAAPVFLLGGMLATTPSHAATISKVANRNPAGACMLSIPTTDTGVRPKASGFRNEGTVNNFVICNFDVDTDIAGFTKLVVNFVSFDGAAHAFDCTGMDRYAGTATGDYATKSVSITAGGTAYISFLPSDFPSTGLVGWNASVTCTLPPGVSIITVAGYHDDNVGA